MTFGGNIVNISKEERHLFDRFVCKMLYEVNFLEKHELKVGWSVLTACLVIAFEIYLTAKQQERVTSTSVIGSFFCS